MKHVWGVLGLMVLLAGSVVAQERAAGGTMETQMTWSALSNKVGVLGTKVDGVNMRVEQVVVCGRKGKVYAPSAGGADSDGCVSTQYINSVIGCGNQGKIYSAASNSCVVPGELASIINCGNQKKVYSASSNSCVDVEGGSRWYAAGAGPSDSPPRGTGSQNGIKSKLRNMGLDFCGSSMSVGRKCSPVGAQCAVLSSTSNQCGSHGDYTCVHYTSTIYRCD